MSEKNKFFSHATLETNVGWLIVLTVFVVAIAGLVQIVPLFFQHSTTKPAEGVTPYSALRLAGRDVYQREGIVHIYVIHVMWCLSPICQATHGCNLPRLLT